MAKLVRDIQTRYRSREKRMIKNAIDNFMNATLEDYPQYISNRSPSFVKYFQIDLYSSTTDENLLNVHSRVGENSPVKYRIINNVTLYTDNPLDIQNEINEYGLISEITGEAIIPPDTIEPRIGDYFVFDLEEELGLINNVVFKIIDVQQSSPTLKKFYRVQYKLSTRTIEELKGNVEEEAFELIYDNVGKEAKTIVKQSEYKLTLAIQVLVDGLIDRYVDDYYDEDLDLFIFEDMQYRPIWDAYLHVFMKKNNILEYYERQLMKEIYLMNLPEKNFKEFYRNRIYNKSIYRNLETQSSRVNPDLLFGIIDTGELNETKLLPFFQHVDDYYYVKYGEDYNPFKSIYLLYDSENLYDENGNRRPGVDNNPPENPEEGDIYFECIEEDQNKVKISMQIFDGGQFIPLNIGERISSDNFMLYPTINNYDFFIENIIIAYLQNRIIVDEFSIPENKKDEYLLLNIDLLEKLNNYEYEICQRNYYLIPMLIYILKIINNDILKL